jgi:hypothetical protein
MIHPNLQYNIIDIIHYGGINLSNIPKKVKELPKKIIYFFDSTNVYAMVNI